MTIALGSRNVSMGSVIAVVGGLLTVVGGVLAWESITAEIAALAGTSASQSGFEFNGGKIILVCGIIALILIGLDMAGQKLPFKVAIVVTIVGVIAALVGVGNYFSVTDDVNKGNAVLAGAASVGVGLYVSIVGAVLVLVGGVADLVMKKE